MAFAPIVGKAFSLLPHILVGHYAISQYSDYRQEGRGMLSSAGSAVFDAALPELMGFGPYLAYEGISHAPSMVIGGAQFVARQSRELERATRDQSPFRNNTFVDSQQIYTMRQAGLALAEQSKYALQHSLMGDEARFMHR